MRNLTLTFALLVVSLVSFSQRIEYKLTDSYTGIKKTVKISSKVIKSLEKYGKVTTLRAVYTMKDGKITMVKRVSKTAKRGNYYVHYRTNAYYVQD